MSSDASVDPATEAAVASESSRGVLRDLLTPAIRFALLLPLLLIALVVVLVAVFAHLVTGRSGGCTSDG